MSRRGASRRDAARGITGQGWPVYAGPRSGIGRREPRRRRGRMSGGAFFCLLFFAQTKKSESPGWAKPKAINQLGNQPGKAPIQTICRGWRPDKAG